MAQVQLTAATVTEPRVIGYDVDTETKFDDDDPTIEKYRGIMRVTIEQDAFNVTGINSIDDQLTIRESLQGRFNQSSVVEILPLVDHETDDFVPFKLTSQNYTPMEMKGTAFFRGVSEWVCVTEWHELNWSS